MIKPIFERLVEQKGFTVHSAVSHHTNGLRMIHVEMEGKETPKIAAEILGLLDHGITITHTYDENNHEFAATISTREPQHFGKVDDLFSYLKGKTRVKQA